MSPTGAGDEEHLSKTEESEVISDVDHNDELDSDIKLEEEEPIRLKVQRLWEIRFVKYVLNP